MTVPLPCSICALADLDGELRAGKSRVEPSARQALVLTRGMQALWALWLLGAQQIFLTADCLLARLPVSLRRAVHAELGRFSNVISNILGESLPAAAYVRMSGPLLLAIMRVAHTCSNANARIPGDATVNSLPLARLLRKGGR